MPVSAVEAANVTAAITLAAARSGVDFDYLFAAARVESGLDPQAAAPTSSARGLYQFTKGTWLDTVRRHGAEHGLGWAADALAAGADPATRAAILDLRRDPHASAAMAAALARDNAASLEHRLGREATATDLYLAHFLGPAGAARFLAARDADGAGAAAGAVLPAAVRANAGVFSAHGRARTLDEVYERFAVKLGASETPPASRHPREGGDPYLQTFEFMGPRLRGGDGFDGGGDDVGSGNPLPPPGNRVPRLTTASAPQAARAAYLLLAELGA